MTKFTLFHEGMYKFISETTSDIDIFGNSNHFIKYATVLIKFFLIIFGKWRPLIYTHKICTFYSDTKNSGFPLFSILSNKYIFWTE